MDAQVGVDTGSLGPPLSLDDVSAASPIAPSSAAADDLGGPLNLEDVQSTGGQPKSWGDWGKGIAEAAAASAYGALGWPYDVYNLYSKYVSQPLASASRELGGTGNAYFPETQYGLQFGESLHPPKNAAERIAAGAAGLGPALFAPEVSLGAAGAKLAAEYGPPAVSAGARALMTAGARPSVGAGLGIAGGASAAEEAARQLLPASWQPIAQPLAGMAGGVSGAGVAEGLGAIPGAAGAAKEGLGWATPENIAGTAIAATPGQQRKAGAILAEGAGSPTALLSGLNEPGEIVPGSVPTLAMQTGLPGIAGLQHEGETSNAVLWQARKEEQDTARTAALNALQPAERQTADGAVPVSAADLPPVVRSQLASLAATGEQGITPLQEAAETTAAAIPKGTVEDVGAGIRGAGIAAQTALKGERAAAYQNASQFGNLLVDASPLRATATELSGNISKLAEQPSGREGAIFDAMKNLPNAIPFGDLQALDSRVTDAMAEAHNNRSQVSWGRLVQLKGAISDAIQNAGTKIVAPQSLRSDVVATKTAVGETGPLILGEISRLPPLPPRPTGPAPTNLQDFIRRAGGVQDEGGDLRVAGLGSVKGLISKSGMPMDEGRRAAAQAGYLGYNPDEAVQASTVPDFIDRLIDHPAYSIHDDEAVAQREAYKRAVEAREQARTNAAPSQIGSERAERALNLAERADRIVAESGVPWHDAYEQAVNEAQNERIAPATSNAGQANEAISGRGAEPSAQTGPVRTGGGTRGAGLLGVPGGVEAGVGSAEAAAALAAAKAAHARYVQFKQGPIGQIVKTKGFADQYTMLAGNAPETIFPAGSGGFETVNRVKSALGDAAPEHLENAAAVSLARTMPLRADGTFDPKKFATWQKNHEPALRAVPDIAQKFSTAAKAAETRDQAAAAMKSAIDDYNSGVLGRIMKLDDPEDVTKAVGRIMDGGTAADLGRLANEASRVDGGKEALRKAAVDAMVQKYTSGTDVISGDAFQKFVRANQNKLGKIFTPEEVDLTNRIVDDIARTQLVGRQSKLAGQSTSAPDMLKALRKGVVKTSGGHGMTFPNVIGAIVFEHMLGFLGPTAGVAALVAATGVSRGRQFIGRNLARNVPELVEEALLNRTGDGTLARALVSKVPRSGEVPAFHRAAAATANSILSQSIH